MSLTISSSSSSGPIQSHERSSSSSPSFRLADSYGPKIDTVLALRKVVEARKLAGDPHFKDIDVPDAFGLLPKDVYAFLTAKNPRFFDWWSELKGLYETLSPEAFLENSQVKQLCEQGQQAIIDAFAERAPTCWDQDLLHWTAQYPNARFTVRSSAFKGEDGKVANAGGNRTESYVPPEQILAECGKVIASYYTLRSFGNQIRAGGNPFEFLELSVGVQEQIGETMGGEADPSRIPISGVIFTNEPLYVGSEQFRVMRITTTFGHGEGVVGNAGVANDTFYVLQSLRNPEEIYIIEDIERKIQRLAPQNGKLELILNPEELIEVPSIDREMVRKLFDLGVALEKNGAPSDIEFVIKRGVKNVVQVRGVNRKPPHPFHYIDLSQLRGHSTEMKVVIPAHMQAMQVDFSKILFCDYLEEAQFIQGDFDLVIIKRDEPSNSHPVINFSERGIPVFYCPEEIEAPTHEETLAFCPQQGIFVRGEAESIVIKEGVIEHPIPLRFGHLEKIPHVPNPGVQREIKRLMQKLTAEETSSATSSSFESAKSVKGIKAAIGWTTFKEKVSVSRAFVGPANRLVGKVREISKALKGAWQNGAGRLEQLIYAKSFRTILTDGAFSVASMDRVLEETVAFERAGGLPALAEELIVDTLEPRMYDDWKKFLLAISHVAATEQIEKFIRLQNALGDLKPLWITFYFDPKRELAPAERLEALLNEFDPACIAFIEGLKHKPISHFLHEDFFETFKTSSPQTRVMTLFYLGKAIEKYDGELKSLKNAPLSQAERVAAFKYKLDPYFDLMKRVATELVGEGKFHFPESSSDPEPSGTLAIYLSILERTKAEIYSRLDLEGILDATQNWDGAEAKLGSGTNFNRHTPRTLEDLFTLTHQNLLACTSFLYQKNLPPLTTIALSEGVQDCMGKIGALNRAQLIGLEQNGDELILGYNIPQRNHSSVCELRYKGGKISLEAKMLGQARNRWREAAALIHMLNWTKVINAQEIRLRGNVLKFVFPINAPEQMNEVCRQLTWIYDLSMGMGPERTNAQLSSIISEHFDEISHGISHLSSPNIICGAIRLLWINALDDDRVLSIPEKYLTHPNHTIRDDCWLFFIDYCKTGRTRALHHGEILSTLEKHLTHPNFAVRRLCFSFFSDYYIKVPTSAPHLHKILSNPEKYLTHPELTIHTAYWSLLTSFCSMGEDQLPFVLPLVKRFLHVKGWESVIINGVVKNNYDLKDAIEIFLNQEQQHQMILSALEQSWHYWNHVVPTPLLEALIEKEETREGTADLLSKNLKSAIEKHEWNTDTKENWENNLPAFIAFCSVLIRCRQPLDLLHDFLNRHEEGSRSNHFSFLKVCCDRNCDPMSSLLTLLQSFADASEGEADPMWPFYIFEGLKWNLLDPQETIEIFIEEKQQHERILAALETLPPEKINAPYMMPLLEALAKRDELRSRTIALVSCEFAERRFIRSKNADLITASCRLLIHNGQSSHALNFLDEFLRRCRYPEIDTTIVLDLLKEAFKEEYLPVEWFSCLKTLLMDSDEKKRKGCIELMRIAMENGLHSNQIIEFAKSIFIELKSDRIELFSFLYTVIEDLYKQERYDHALEILTSIYPSYYGSQRKKFYPLLASMVSKGYGHELAFSISESLIDNQFAGSDWILIEALIQQRQVERVIPLIGKMLTKGSYFLEKDALNLLSKCMDCNLTITPLLPILLNSAPITSDTKNFLMKILEKEPVQEILPFLPTFVSLGDESIFNAVLDYLAKALNIAELHEEATLRLGELVSSSYSSQLSLYEMQISHRLPIPLEGIKAFCTKERIEKGVEETTGGILLYLFKSGLLTPENTDQIIKQCSDDFTKRIHHLIEQLIEQGRATMADFPSM